MQRHGFTAGLTAALIVILVAPAMSQVQPVAARASSAVSGDVEHVDLLVGRSAVIRTDRPIKRVALPKPEIADALVTSPNEVLVHGKMPGTISLLVWGDTGQIRTYDIVVQRDLSSLEERIRQLFPGEAITVSSNGADVVLSGTVSSKYIVDKASSLALGYVEKKENVVNLLRQDEGQASNQVLLRVRFAEVSRTALQELGASFFTSPTGVKNVVGRTSTGQFAAPGFDKLQWSKESSDFGAPVTSASGEFTFSDFLNLFLLSEKYDLGMMVRALASKGLFQSLAEPNLVTQNGKEASFLAGGEYPYPVVQGAGANQAVTIMFKEFGVRLRFTPTITGPDSIHLKVAPEVSALDFANAITASGFRVPAISSRRTETEVELRDGQTFAIAGLIDNSVTQTMSKIPGIGDIPILGLLFRSRAYQKNATELVVMITPQILRRDSVGVTGELPRLVTPFIPQERKTMPPPAPAFSTPEARSVAPVPPDPGGMAAAPGAMANPLAAPPVQAAEGTSLVERPRPEDEAREREAAREAARAAEAARRQEEADRREAEKQAEIERRQAAARAEVERREAEEQAEIARRQAAKQAEIDRRNAEKQARLEREQAKKQAALEREEAKRQAALEKKQAALEKKRLKEEQKRAERARKEEEKLERERARRAAEEAARQKKLEQMREEAERKKAEERREEEERLAAERAKREPWPRLRSRL